MAVTKTSPVPVATTIDLTTQVAGLEHETKRIVLVERPPGPPRRINGYTIGAGYVSDNGPHGGELHPDGDELLYLISGRVEVVLELDEGTRRIELNAGDAMVVPQGVWHRIFMKQPAQLLNITPGPHGDHRSLSDPNALT